MEYFAIVNNSELPKNNIKKMFGLFKKKTEKEKLQKQYETLLKEAHSLSSVDRRMSDQKTFEAQEILKMIEKLN